MKEKYGEQDEDERAFRMQLIGAKQIKGFKIEEDPSFFAKNKQTTKEEESIQKETKPEETAEILQAKP